MHMRINDGKHLCHRQILSLSRVGRGCRRGGRGWEGALVAARLGESIAGGHKSPLPTSPPPPPLRSSLLVDGIQFSPEFIRDRLLCQLQRLCEPLRTCHANNCGCDAHVPQRELQRRCRQWQAIAPTCLLHLPGASKQFGRCLVIHIAWVGTWPFRQDAAPIWRSIQSCNSPACAYLPERFSLPVEEREAVMRNSRLEEVGFDKADHHVDWAAGNTQVRDQALFFTLL